MEWSNAATAIVGKNLQICSNLDPDCESSSIDDDVVTVKTVHKYSTMGGDATHTDHNEGCGTAVACVKFDTSDLSDSACPGPHLGDMSLIIEEPAHHCRASDPNTDVCLPAQDLWVYWTDVDSDQGYPVPRVADSMYAYIGYTMVHEFGHTLGLTDFGRLDSTLTGLPAVMFDPVKNKMVMPEDIKQLHAIYRVHDSARH